MKIHYLQHVPFETPALVYDWAKSQRHEITGTKLFQDDPLPDIETVDWLVVMGGPMGIYDEKQFPWLVEEKKFIEWAIKRDKGILGICLGSQLIADVLGAKVYRNKFKEIGWYPVQLTEGGKESSVFGFLPDNFNVFHWHGDTYDLPKGAVHIAKSKACENQAFQLGTSIVGLQFHMELTPSNTRELIHHCSEDLTAGPFVQSADDIIESNSFLSRHE